MVGISQLWLVSVGVGRHLSALVGIGRRWLAWFVVERRHSVLNAVIHCRSMAFSVSHPQSVFIGAIYELVKDKRKGLKGC